MRFTTVFNGVFGRGVPQFELHKAECQDVPVPKYKHGEARIIEARDIPEALSEMIDADMREMGYSISDVRVYNCAKGGKTMSESKKEVKQSLKPANKMSKEDREKQIAEHVARKKADQEAKKASGAGIDKALNDQMVKKPTEAKEHKKPSVVIDPNLLSISDIARDLEIEPKAARAKLRRVKGKAEEGRWPKVKRDSKEHKELVALLTANKEEETEAE